MTQDIIKMFEGNDFGSRKGVIGCALTHYTLWIKLLKDPVNQYYIIMEDDVKLCNNFNKKLNALKYDFINKDLIFMGYHMLQKKRESLAAVYDIESDGTNLSRLSKQLYIGGTFCYSINKKGAFKLLSYIKDNGIKHGIDYLIKINKDVECYETQPALAFSVWNENGAAIDTDIQNSAP
jgi:GR25 family glycosyltransferase involved in LPS biosynthesis